MTNRPECTHPGPCETRQTIFDEEVCILPDQDTDQAISIVAQQVAHCVVYDALGELWENYPGIGEDDWMRVAAMAENLALPPNPDTYAQAYDHLVRRATAIT